MGNEKKAKETEVKEAKVLVKSDYPIAEVIQEEGNDRIILEGKTPWFRLVKRSKGKKTKSLLIDGDTTYTRFKRDCESFLANK